MKINTDPRMKIARRVLGLAWIFYSVFVATVMILGFSLEIKPYIFGLPGWLTVSLVFVPIGFVILLIFFIEKIIPDIPLTDEDSKGEED